jgi:putative ATP-dependent endonuclease of OLD family
MEDDQIERASNIINANLTEIEGNRLQQRVRLGFAPPDFGRVVDSLRPLLSQTGDSGFRANIHEEQWRELLKSCSDGVDILQDRAQTVDDRVIVDLSDITESEQEAIGEVYDELLENIVGVLELTQNGMGYNNLIYMGTVLGNLKEWQEVETDSYNALLIEEPEAHLHPQLQDLVLAFLRGVSEERNEKPIQIFTTTHSPTLTSQASLDNITMLFEGDDAIKALPLGICPLDPFHKTDLERYLDVTKAQLFFAKGVVLVEGISEALLLPAFAKLLERRLDQNAVEVISVAGTAFAPFAHLFNSEEDGKRIDIPCGILTDDDRCSCRDDEYRLTDGDLSITFVGKNESNVPEIIPILDRICSKLQQGSKSDRASKAEGLEGGNLIVKTAFKTFEYELAVIPGNIAPMLDALQNIHPKITKGLRGIFANQLLSSEHKAICLWLATGDVKAEFAQRLARLLGDPSKTLKEPFAVPSYIAEVLKHVAPVKTGGSHPFAEKEHE